MLCISKDKVNSKLIRHNFATDHKMYRCSVRPHLDCTSAVLIRYKVVTVHERLDCSRTT